MKNERIFLLTLAAIEFTDILDFMIIMPLGKRFMEEFHITPAQFSLILASYAITAASSGLLNAMFVDRFDRKKVLLWIYAGFTVGTFACSIATTYYFFLAARSLTGVFGGLMIATVFSIVADVVPYERRSQAIGFVMSAFSVASVVGVPLGLYIGNNFGWRVIFLGISVLCVFIFFLIYYQIPPLTKHIQSDKTHYPNTFQILKAISKDNNQLIALLFTMVLMLGHFTIIPFIAPYMEMNIGFSKNDITLIYVIGGTLSVILMPQIGKIADKYGNAKVFTVSSIFALFSIFAVTNLPSVSVALALCVTSSFFVVASGRSVPATTLSTGVVNPEERGRFMSIRSSVTEATIGIASLIAGQIIIKNPDETLTHYERVGYFAIAMSILAIWLAWKLNKKERA